MDSRRAFVATSAIVFAASAAMTIVTSASMASMGAMVMPGGWTLSLMWMRMPGQTWFGSAVSFVSMWTVMMVAMMLPSLTPTLWRYRVAGGTVGGVLVGVGYFAVWAAFGLMVFPLGAVMAATLMREPALARAVPMVVGVAVSIAGVFQRTPWKARHLAFCREAPVEGRDAVLYGVRLGAHCTHSCLGLTTVVLGLGVMNLPVMALVTAAITAEHLAPGSARLARVIGGVVVAGGVCLIARAAGVG